MQELVKIIHHILSQRYHKLFIEYFNNFQHIFIMRQQIRQQTLHHIFNKQTETHLQQTLSQHSSQHLRNIFATSSQHLRNIFHNILRNIFTTFFNKHFNKLFDKIFNDKLHDEDYSFQQMYSQIMIQCSSHAL